jgi:hypothetical protein
MKTTFRPEELIERKSRDGKVTKFPILSGRLRITHSQEERLSIQTELIQFEAQNYAVTKATVTTDKGTFTAYGTASTSRDRTFIESLVELSESRSISRSLRWCQKPDHEGVGYNTGNEELPNDADNKTPANITMKQETTKTIPFPVSDGERRSLSFIPATKPQMHAIKKFASIKDWNVIECCRRILKEPAVQSVDDLSKDQASEVISTMKEAA